VTRLIDADAIPYVTDETYFHEFDYAYRYAIDALPTVEAIPIEWLTAQADNPSNSDKLRNAIDYIVYTLWAERREHEQTD
jgi:hypothetical protein